ncbi:MAG: hypothetical protein J0M18_09145 [Ignavibacteria bacterium]|jgi:hypothetical protein|nr:hypothetical protein [Ignavibacteria bacterium]
MKKFFIYLITPLIFITQNLFAQSVTNAEGMDMSVYASWMGSSFLILLFVMIGIFLFSASKEPANPDDIMLQFPAAFSNEQVNIFASGSSLYLLPSLSLELNRIKVIIVSALITFSLILLLLIIQK